MIDMLDFKTSINKKYDRTDNILLCGLLCIVALGFFRLMPAFVGLLGLITFLSTGVLLYFKKTKQKPVILSFEKHRLIVKDNPPIEIDYMEIQRITLEYIAIKGDGLIGSVYFPIGIPNTGQVNTITIITKKEEKITRNIWCETDKDYWRLKSLGKFLKEQGVNVKMKGFLR